MNYRFHHDKIIERASLRILDGYAERHHILPRCMSGSNKVDNLVRLTPEEHFVIHQLLVKMYPDVPYLVNALVKMAHHCNNNKLYGWIRRRHAEAVSRLMTGNKSWLGKQHTEAWKAARRAEMLGKKMSPEAIEKMAVHHRGKKLSDWHLARIIDANRGKSKSPETRRKMSLAATGRRLSAEARAKIAASNRRRKGEKRHVKGLLPSVDGRAALPTGVSVPLGHQSVAACPLPRVFQTVQSA